MFFRGAFSNPGVVTSMTFRKSCMSKLLWLCVHPHLVPSACATVEHDILCVSNLLAIEDRSMKDKRQVRV